MEFPLFYPLFSTSSEGLQSLEHINLQLWSIALRSQNKSMAFVLLVATYLQQRREVNIDKFSEKIVAQKVL